MYACELVSLTCHRGSVDVSRIVTVWWVVPSGMLTVVELLLTWNDTVDDSAYVPLAVLD